MLKLSNVKSVLLNIKEFWLGGVSNFNFFHLKTIGYCIEGVSINVHDSFTKVYSISDL